MREVIQQSTRALAPLQYGRYLRTPWPPWWPPPASPPSSPSPPASASPSSGSATRTPTTTTFPPWWPGWRRPRGRPSSSTATPRWAPPRQGCQGGWSWEKHAASQLTIDKIRARPWDVVVLQVLVLAPVLRHLQEYSTRPAYETEQVCRDTVTNLDSLVSMIL